MTDEAALSADSRPSEYGQRFDAGFLSVGSSASPEAQSPVGLGRKHDMTFAELLYDCLGAQSHSSTNPAHDDGPMSNDAEIRSRSPQRISLADAGDSTRSVLSISDFNANFDLVEPLRHISLDDSTAEESPLGQEDGVGSTDPGPSVSNVDENSTVLPNQACEDDNAAFDELPAMMRSLCDGAPCADGKEKGLLDAPRLTISSWDDESPSQTGGLEAQLLKRATLDESMLLPALIHARTKALNPLTDDNDKYVSPHLLYSEIAPYLSPSSASFPDSFVSLPQQHRRTAERLFPPFAYGPSNGAVPVWEVPVPEQRNADYQKLPREPPPQHPNPHLGAGRLRTRSSSDASSSLASVASLKRPQSALQLNPAEEIDGQDDEDRGTGQPTACVVPGSGVARHQPKKKRVALIKEVTKPVKAPLVGEHRLKINFISLGNLGEVVQHFGKKRCRIPDGLAGTHELYNQKWRFEVDHRRCAEAGSADPAAVTTTINWRITNLGSGTLTERCETAHEAFIREYKGQTICNQVLRDALDSRAKELESLLKGSDGRQRQLTANLEASLRALRPRKCIMGLLFFGLLHQCVQDNLRKQLAARPQQQNQPSPNNNAASPEAAGPA